MTPDEDPPKIALRAALRIVGKARRKIRRVKTEQTFGILVTYEALLPRSLCVSILFLPDG